MFATQLLFNELESTCPGIHETRLEALLDVASALQRSQNLSLNAMGKHLSGNAERKHKIKKVDRLEGNKHLHSELDELYKGLSGFVFKYIAHAISVQIIVDFCNSPSDFKTVDNCFVPKIFDLSLLGDCCFMHSFFIVII